MKHVQNLLAKVREQRRTDGLLVDLPSEASPDTLLNLESVQTLPLNYPIHSTSRADWIKLSRGEQQRIMGEKWAVVISGDPDTPGDFDPETLSELGDLHQVRETHGKLKDDIIAFDLLTWY
jgi:hypothetical protein